MAEIEERVAGANSQAGGMGAGFAIIEKVRNDAEYKKLDNLHRTVILPGFNQIRGINTLWFLPFNAPTKLVEGGIDTSTAMREPPHIICNYGSGFGKNSIFIVGRRFIVRFNSRNDKYEIDVQKWENSKTETDFRTLDKHKIKGDWMTVASSEVEPQHIDGVIKDRIAEVLRTHKRINIWRFGLPVVGLAGVFLFKACASEAKASEMPEMPDEEQPVAEQNLEP